MFSLRFAIAALFLATSAIAAQAPATRPKLSPETREFVSVDAPIVALTHVKLIDGTGAPAVDDQTVVIQNGKISAVGKTGVVVIPKGAKVLELAGHSVYPGFVGLHNHTYYNGGGRSVQGTTTAPRLYLGSGVTTIRTTGSMWPYDELNLKKSIDAGEVPGPRMFVTGPYINGGPPGGRMTNVATAVIRLLPGPLMYGPVTNMRGPATSPASIDFFRLSSSYGHMLPVVRIVVTPFPRYSRGAVTVPCTLRPPPS